MIRVLIAAESEMARRGLESILAGAPSIELLASLDSLANLGRSIQPSAPDVVVVAAESGLEELEFEPMMGGAASPPAFVVLTSDAAAASALDLQRAGIAALLPVDATAGQVLASINSAAEGLIVVHPAMIGPEADGLVLRNPDGPAPQLTAREREILTMLAEGLGNKEIAWRLKISEHTVKFHVSSIFTKLDVSSRAEAVSLGFRLGLILI
ncbi:MAG: response regulator transcription factor [Terriglobia bacterium]